MKNSLYYCLFGTLIFFSSCKSEYEERLIIGRQLKDRMTEIDSNHEFEENMKRMELNELKKELAFHAKISGNESMFYEELELDKSQF